jgi:FtsH-binding integral membrane protein
VSFELLILACVLAVLALPAGMLLAWGFAGGDGEAESVLLGLCGAGLAGGSLYNVALTFAAFSDVLQVRWWLMWVAPITGLFGLILSAGELRREGALTMAWALAVPVAASVVPLLIYAAGAAEL